MIKKLIRLVTLRPFGDSLSSPTASAWMTCAMVGLLLVALSESVAWGYVGYLIGGEWHPRLSAIAVAAVAFLAAWIVDATFLTMDLRRHMYELKAPTERRSAVRTSLQSPLVGVVVRTAMVAGSLYISAPYVSQVVMYRDVSTVLASSHAADIRSRRDMIASEHDGQIDALRHQQDILRNAVILESAGNGPSHRPGRGPVVRTMEAQSAQLDRLLNEARTAKEAALSAYDTMSPDELFRKYGVATDGTGLQARNEALEAIKSRPGYRMSEWTVRAFLFGLFLMMMILKFYQSPAAQLYYSESCQDAYIRYRTGQFDDRLGQHEKASAGGAMTPMRFDKWLRTDYADCERDMRNASVLGSVLNRQKLEEGMIKEIQQSAESDLAPLLADYDEAQSHATTIQEQVTDFESQLASLAVQIAEHEEAIVVVDRAIAQPQAVGGVRPFVKALSASEAWRATLAGLQKQHRTTTLELETTKARLVVRQAEAERIQTAIGSKSTVLASADDRINGSRNRAFEEIGNLSS